MSEIRLQCPGCGTEYHLPEGAIPMDGRQVECTSCDHIWLAVAETTGNAGKSSKKQDEQSQESGAEKSGIIRHDPPSSTIHESAASVDESSSIESPPLAKRIPESVLSILREEVEFERRARHREITENSSEPFDHDWTEQNWPATTITDTTPASESTSALHKVAKDDTTRPGMQISGAHPAENSAAGSITPAPESGISETSQETAEPVKLSKRSHYLSGFGVALATAAAAAALYVVAPELSGNDRFGAGLSQYRETMDAGRDWLSLQASLLSK